MALDPLTAKLLLSSATTDKGKKIIGITLAAVVGTILLLFLLIGMLLSSVYFLINPQLGGDLTQDPHYQAIQDIKYEYGIDNDLELSYLKIIQLLDTHDLPQDKNKAKEYIINYFVQSYEETISSQPEDMTLPPEEVTVIRYKFLSNGELMQTIILPPFNFKEEDLDVIRNMVYSVPTSPSDLIFNGRYPMPISGRVTSAYGKRIDPITGKDDFHTGIDIQGIWHSSIVSIADGVVYEVGRDDVYGDYILIEHNEDDQIFYSFYAHLSRQFVAKGQKVRQGVVIGQEGGDPQRDLFPGRSTGHHLHFGIYATPKRGSHLDPTGFLYSPKGV